MTRQTKNARQRPQWETEECSEEDASSGETELPVEDTNPQSVVRDAQDGEWINVRRIRRRQLAEGARQTISSPAARAPGTTAKDEPDARTTC